MNVVAVKWKGATEHNTMQHSALHDATQRRYSTYPTQLPPESGLFSTEQRRQKQKRTSSQPVLVHENALLLVEDQNRRRDHCRPQSALVADGRLRDICCAYDLVRDPIDFLLFVPRSVWIEVHVQRSREHFRGEFLGVVAGRILGLSE